MIKHMKHASRSESVFTNLGASALRGDGGDGVGRRWRRGSRCLVRRRELASVADGVGVRWRRGRRRPQMASGEAIVEAA